MAKMKGKARGKPRARPQTARRKSKRGKPTEPAVASIPPATVHENESEDQAGAYGDDRGETDFLQP